MKKNSVVLSDSVRKQLEEALSEFQYPWSPFEMNPTEEAVENYVDVCFKTVVANLPLRILRLINEMKSKKDTPGYLIVENSPADPNQPTPKDGLRSNVRKQTTISENFLAGISKILGEPIGHVEEKEGSLIHDVVSKRVPKDHNSNEGYQFFNLHVENAAFEIRERFLGLSIINGGDPESGTTISDYRIARSQLSNEDINVLRQKKFKIRRPYILDGKGVPLYTAPVAVETGPIDAPEARVTFYPEGTIGIDPASQTVLEKLKVAMENCATKVSSKERRLILLDNRIMTHGRAAFKPTFDENDRYFLRTYIVSDLWDLRDIQSERTRILRRSKQAF